MDVIFALLYDCREGKEYIAMNKKEINRDLVQILINIVIIGAFSIMKDWLLFYYDGTWHMPVIFAVLTVLMFCVLTINIYNCIQSICKKESSDDLSGQLQRLEQELEEIKLNQLRSTKVILKREEELQNSLRK